MGAAIARTELEEEIRLSHGVLRDAVAQNPTAPLHPGRDALLVAYITSVDETLVADDQDRGNWSPWPRRYRHGPRTSKSCGGWRGSATPGDRDRDGGADRLDITPRAIVAPGPPDNSG